MYLCDVTAYAVYVFNMMYSLAGHYIIKSVINALSIGWLNLGNSM